MENHRIQHLFFNTLQQDWIALLKSKRFWGTIICYCTFRFTFILLYTSLYHVAFWNLKEMGISALYLMEFSIAGTSLPILLIGILPTFPFSGTMRRDRENGAIWFWIIRCGSARYVISKFIVCFFAGFLCLLGGELITLALLAPAFPMTSEFFYPLRGPKELIQSAPYLYALLLYTDEAMNAALFACLGMMLTLFVSDCIAYMVLPSVIYFFLQRITASIAPHISKWISWLLEGIASSLPWWEEVALKAVVVIALCTTFLAISILKLRRRQ